LDSQLLPILVGLTFLSRESKLPSRHQSRFPSRYQSRFLSRLLSRLPSKHQFKFLSRLPSRHQFKFLSRFPSRHQSKYQYRFLFQYQSRRPLFRQAAKHLKEKKESVSHSINATVYLKPYPKIFPVGHLVPKNLALFKMPNPTEWATTALTESVVPQVVDRINNLV
jgi:hypothetical protein